MMVAAGAENAQAQASSAQPDQPTQPAVLQSTIGDAVRQMQQPHQADPNGVPPSYSWAAQPVIQAGNRPPANFKAITGWGQVFLASDTSPIKRTISLRNFKTYVLNNANQLVPVQSATSLDGSQFNTDYANNANTPASISNTASGLTTVPTDPTKSFQFWPSEGKAAFDPSTLKGIIVAVEAKIDAPAGTTDPLINNNYVLSVGADYWLATNSVWDNYRSSAGVGTGRFTFLTTSWQCYTMTTITGQDLTILPMAFAC